MMRSNLSAMLLGTLVAQGLPIALSPLLARLFPPEAFGLQALVMGLSAILVVIATLRLDLALVIAADDQEARHLSRIIACSGAIVVFGFSAILALFGPQLAELAGYPHALPALWIVPVLLAATASFQVAIGFWSRAGNFKPVALSNVKNQLGYAATALWIGMFAGGGALGLAIAKLVGQVAGAALLWGRSYPLFGSSKTVVHRAPNLGLLWRKFKPFIIFNTPYSLVGTATRESPILILTAIGALPAAGFFGLARTITSAPGLLAANAFSPIFYREAASRHGTPAFFRRTHQLLTVGFFGLSAPFAFCAVWGDVFFTFAFGDAWGVAGQFAMILAPAAWLSAQTGWPERLAEASGRQGVTFTVQVISDAASILAMIALYAATGSATMLVAGFAIANCIYHICYLSALYHVAGFPVRSAIKLCLASGGYFAVVALGLWIIRLASGDGFAGMGGALVVSVGIFGVTAGVLHRLWSANWRET